ncbi:iron ABC transporter permease [Acidovorax sp. SUPP2522]|uniref:FecCD family ABC transporter permease n=1 Tax=unclassified Acidovorax TaxID=2684926 RepID=UPI00234A95F1|nr:MULTISPECIES: iron ABC transporter permease [unclassified Acidovorax]WCM95521.1 iron ABC transporter permease [Acidovorax sp. GBBC 1281]GKT18243.1 iron ABC transporter permease [Acidovorax sp. SUPP2522]
MNPTGAGPASPASFPTSPAIAALQHAVGRLRASRWRIAALAVFALGLAVLASLSLGVQSQPVGTVLRQLLSLLPGLEAWAHDGPQRNVLLQLRLPRTAMALVCGAGLSMAGVAMQGITRNPLVSPYTLGISPAAAFGASIAILLGWNTLPATGAWWTVALAFASAMVCAAGVLGLASLRGVHAMVLVLAGVAFTYLFGALTAALQFFASEQQLAAIVHWTFGSLNGRSWNEVGVAGGICLVCAPVLLAHAGALNAFSAGGDDVAASLGVPVARARIAITLAAVLCSAAIVSFTGVIGFVGLVAPHIARLLIGGDHRALLPFAAVVGALLVLLADMAGRLLFAPVVVLVGIVVAFLGVPLFLHLLLTRCNEMSA